MFRTVPPPYPWGIKVNQLLSPSHSSSVGALHSSPPNALTPGVGVAGRQRPENLEAEITVGPLPFPASLAAVDRVTWTQGQITEGPSRMRLDLGKGSPGSLSSGEEGGILGLQLKLFPFPGLFSLDLTLY